MLQYAVTAKSLLQAAGIAATVYLLIQLWVASRDPLRTVPGVLWARYTRLWEWFENLGGEFERTNMKLHDKYGDVVRLSPNRYSIRGADNIKKIYGPGSKFQKTAFYEPFGTPDANARDVFSERNGHKHSVTRREISSLYSMSSLVSYEAVVESASTYFCQQLERLASEGKRFDLFEWMQFYAFDTIGELTVGKRFGMMAEGKDVGGILSTVDGANRYGSRAGILPELHYTLGFALAVIVNPFKSIQMFANTHIKECEEKPMHNDKETFVQKCLDLKNDGKLTDWNFFNVIAQNIGAGSDTTGITLSSIIFHLYETPAALAKLRSEFIEARKDGRISDPITFKEAQTLHYFQAVIKEGLRIHPAVGQIMPRVVPEGGAQLAGRFFPAGVEVGVNPWVSHHDISIWGPDAATFRPERWLDSNIDLRTLEQNFVPFGVGSRTCIGKNISLLELNKLLPAIVEGFDFHRVANEPFTTSSAWFVKPRVLVTISKTASASQLY